MSKPTLAFYGIKDRNSFEYPAYVHDHNLCLMQDGKILQYLHLERHTRRKYDNRLDLFIEELIDSRAIELPDEFDLVGVNLFVGSAFISKNGRLHFEADRPKALSFNLQQAHAYFQYNVWEGKQLNAYRCQHEVAHICSTMPFFGHFKDNSLLVSIDGGSSEGNYSAFLYRDGNYQLLENGWDDLSYASKLFNDNALSFMMLGASPGEHCSVPGKLMGFASWGCYNPEIEKWFVENQYFKDWWHKEDDILQLIKDRFGIVANFDTHDKFMQECAATFQRIFEKAILQKFEALQQKYNCENLYYGGGCALNIVTNTKIVESGMFRNVYIAPCCNDSGLSIGAAALLETMKGNEIQTHNPYQCNIGLGDMHCSVNENEIARVAELIMQHKIVGVCNGNAEAGPRALGNRSLIALADSQELAARLSMEVKRREWYRPLAPIMLLDNAKMVVEQKVTELARFMLQDFTVKPEYRNRMAGVVHANNTARIQTVASESENPFIHRLLLYLQQKYGVIALINTSFNAQGEPIVHTAEQALASAMRMGIDGVVINGKLEVLK